MANKNDYGRQSGTLEPPKIYNGGAKMPQNDNDGDKKKSKKKKKPKRSKRRLKSKVKKVIISVVAVIILLLVAVILSLTVFFNITDIKITGSGTYSSEDIELYSGIDYGDNMFLIRSDDVAESLEQNLPYIYSVQIKRSLPSTVTIKITEATVAYTIEGEDETYIYLDDNLKVLEVGTEENYDGAIEIKNADLTVYEPGFTVEFNDENTITYLTKLIEVIEDVDMYEATAIYSEGKSANYITYDDRIVIELGDTDDLEDKLYRALAVCDEMNETNSSATGTLDVSSGKQSYFTAE